VPTIGIPMQVSRSASVVTSLKRSDEQKLVDTVAARIPTWKAGMLNTTGRLALVKSTLSAILVHVSISCCLSAWAIGEIDRRRRAFLWCGTDRASGGVLGFAIRLRWEWLRRTQPDSTWAALPQRTEKTVASMFKASVTVAVGDGASARFWTDSWLPRLDLSQPHRPASTGQSAGKGEHER